MQNKIPSFGNLALVDHVTKPSGNRVNSHLKIFENKFIMFFIFRLQLGEVLLILLTQQQEEAPWAGVALGAPEPEVPNSKG